VVLPLNVARQVRPAHRSPARHLSVFIKASMAPGSSPWRLRSRCWRELDRSVPA